MAGSISSTGLGSGLDINGLVDKLVALEKQPLQGLQKAASKINTQISTFGALASQLGALDDATQKLGSASKWAVWKVASSNTSAVGASVTGSTEVVGGNYTLEVSQLAASQSVISTALGASEAVGTGSLRLPRNGSTVDVTISASNNTPAGIAAAINAADADVRASVLTDASGTRLVLTGKASGAGQSFSVSVTTTDPAGTGLNRLAYDAASNTGALTRTSSAQDAQFKLNGVSLTSASNQLTGTVPGLSLTLNQVTTGAVTLNVTPDADARKAQVQAFVTAFNQLATSLGTVLAYDPATRNSGPLQGDATARSLQSALRSALRGVAGTGGGYQSLSDVGIVFQKDGTTLAIDDSKGKFSAALANGEALGKLFNDSTNGIFAKLKTLTGKLADRDSGPLASRTTELQDALKRNAADQQKVSDRADRVQKQLLQRYNAMDSLVARSNALNNYLSQQITTWNNQAKGNN